MEWVGDTALLLEVRRAIADVQTEMAEHDMARLSELCVSNKGLAGLYDRLGISELVRGDTHNFDQRRKAGIMGMMGYELQTMEREGTSEQALMAKRTMQLLTYATITVTLPVFKPRQPRGLPAEVQTAVDRLKRHESRRDDPDWTHSSLMGGRDPITGTGKLKVPDDKQSQQELASAMVMCYNENQPLTLVERTTQHFPYIEDLDIEVVVQSKGPRDYLLYTHSDAFQFLRFRAAILHKLFPTITELKLLLYTGSGWHTQKKCYKTSFHCVWPQLVVDRERAHVVRLKTIDTFQKEAKVPSSWCERLTAQVAAASGKDENTWETVFDITGVRAGSLRMPFNDKVMALTGKLEGRPLMPVAGYMFTFDAASQLDIDRNPESTVTQEVDWVNMTITHRRESCREEDWIRMGTVRRSDEEPLTEWVSPVPRKDWAKRQKASGGSGRRPVYRPPSDPVEAKKEEEEYEEDMRKIRRKFEGSADEFKMEVNKVMGDPDGNLSTWEELKHRDPECRKFMWKHTKLKGSISFTTPSGEVLVNGNDEQKIFMMDLLKGWTGPWDGPIPPMGGGKGKGRKGKGKGKGKSKGKGKGKGKGQGKGKGRGGFPAPANPYKRARR